MITNKKYNNANNSINSEESQNKDEMSEKEVDELKKQLETINISLDTVYVILTAVLINIEYLTVTRQELIDKIDGTNLADNMIDVSKFPKLSNTLFIYATAMFLTINMQQYLDILELPYENTILKKRRKARKAFITSFLIYIATCISSGNLEV